jgi:two-component system, LytTR family, sensor kinase
MTPKNPFLIFLLHKRWQFARHLILILVLALNYNLLSPDSLKQFALSTHVEFIPFYFGQCVNMLFSLTLVYINLYFLFPKYFKKGLYTKYSIGVFVLIVIFFLLSYTSQYINVHYFGKIELYTIQLGIDDFIQTVMYPLVFLASTTGYKIFKTWIIDQERFAALEKEQLKSELTELKNQVNPHFLFNTLNNLHVLIKTNPDKASDIVFGLSDVLRYQISDSQNDKVSLKKDIEILEQYLELEKIRRDDLTITVSKDGCINNVMLPPLLFTNFIDNAIKHSLSRDASFIQINFNVKDNFFYFEITNSKSVNKIQTENTGLGLTNVRKRLALLYGNSHTIEINDEKLVFTVKVKLPI